MAQGSWLSPILSSETSTTRQTSTVERQVFRKKGMKGNMKIKITKYGTRAIHTLVYEWGFAFFTLSCLTTYAFITQESVHGETDGYRCSWSSAIGGCTIYLHLLLGDHSGFL